MTEFARPIVFNERGRRVRDAQYVLQHNRFHRNFHPGPLDGIWGRHNEAAADEARWILGYPAAACKTGVFGQQLYDYLRADGHAKRLPTDYLGRRIRRLAAERTHQLPALPPHVWFPGVSYPRPNTPHGLQPWIEPQAEAIAAHFGLARIIGYGGHPPHGYYSDHRWGGAVDLVGTKEAMVQCTLWADSLCSGFYRRGAVFRWVGGPAHDRNGIEPGHYNHVHLSWFRRGPATTVFGTAGFPS